MSMHERAFAEIIGTFMMVFVGYGSIVLSEKYPHSFPAYLIPVAWGLTIAVMIKLVGHVSGAHFNPAVTLVFAAAKRISFNEIPLYWGSQFFGGVAALGFVEAIKKL